MTAPDITVTLNGGNESENAIGNATKVLARDMAFTRGSVDAGFGRAEQTLSLLTGQVAAAHGIYTANAEVINGAFKAIGTLLGSDMAKKTTSDVLSVAKKVIAGLDCVQNLHPFVGVAVLAFKGIIALEMKRRENDKRVSALLIQATDMMSEIMSLQDLKDPDQILPSGQSVRGRLQTILDAILTTITDCGNAIDKYFKSKIIARFFKSIQWEDKFVGFANSFSSLKKDIKNALIIRTALRMEDAIDGVAKLDVKLDAILSLIHAKNPAEEDVRTEVAKRGGAEAVLNNSTKIKEIIEKTERSTAPGSNKQTAPEEKSVEAAVLHDLRTPLETQLEENRKSFEVTLEMKTAEITDAIQRTESRILHAFNKGAYTRVKDPHIRYVWRTMKWALSVQTAYFIPALHDYFSERVGSANDEQPLPTGVSGPPSPTLSAATKSSITGDEVDLPPPLTNEDEWCLEYLSIWHVPALKEAFDDDTNGLVNVREVNLFARSRSMPSHWSILKRLAYAARGWRVEIARYANRIQALLNTMVYDSNNALPGNRAFVCAYLDSTPIEWVKQIARGIAENDDGFEMNELVTERMEEHEAYLAQLLAKVQYELTSAESVALYFGRTHIDHYIVPLIYVILLRHAQLVNLAKRVLLDRRELELGSTSLRCTCQHMFTRGNQLAETFRQQGFEPDIKFESFFGGMYRFFWNESKAPQDYEYWTNHRQVVDEYNIDVTVLDASALRYGTPDPAKTAYGPEWQDEISASNDLTYLGPLSRFQNLAARVLLQVQQSRRWDHLAARRHAMREYETVAIPAALDALQMCSDGPPVLTPEQREKLQKLCLLLAPRDLAYCRAKGDLDLRNAMPVHPNYCDACHCGPITTERYDCLDCANVQYQLCRNCVNLPTDKFVFTDSEHTINHNMSLFRVEIPSQRALRFRYGREDLRFCVPELPDEAEDKTKAEDKTAASADETAKADDKAAASQPGVEHCAECKKDLPGAFYACSTCGERGLTMCVLCDVCTFKKDLENVPDHSQVDHFMTLIRNRRAAYITGRPDVSATTDEDEDGIHKLSTRMDAIDARMNTMVELLQALHTAPGPSFQA